MILKEAGSMAALEAMCSSADKTAASYAQAAIENLKISKKLRDSTLPQVTKKFNLFFCSGHCTRKKEKNFFSFFSSNLRLPRCLRQ